MGISYQNFVGGPWDDTSKRYPAPVPPVRVPVYADAPGVVCADEQVVTLLGTYERAESSHIGWYYDWVKA